MMQLAVTGRQIQVTEAMRAYATSKIERLGKHAQMLDGHVTLSVDRLEHRAEATLTVSGRTVHADANGQDVYAAIDVLVDKLDRQLLKHKEKRADHRP